MHSVRELAVDLAPVRALISALRAAPSARLQGAEELQPSPLYLVESQARIVDEEQRLSRYRLFKDEALFDLVEQVAVGALNRAERAAWEFSLVRNDATFIEYDKGGFFAKHSDFLSFHSNVVEEFTLILSLTPPTQEQNPDADELQGGETRLEFNPHFAHTSVFTTRPDCGLLFRKDVPHEGLLVKAGKKRILTLNILAKRRASEHILVVTFPNETVSAPASVSSLPSFVPQDEAQAFVIPVSCFIEFPDSFLAGLVRFEQSASSAAPAKTGITHYACTSVPRQAFATVYRALNRHVLTEEELREYAQVLDLFNIDVGRILVEMTSAKVVNPISTTTDSVNGLTMTPSVSSSSTSTVYVAQSGNVILCDIPERTHLLLRTAVERSEPWVQFRMLFGEGDVWEDPELSESRRLEMQPLLATAGSRENILFFRYACHAKQCQLPNHKGLPFPKACQILHGKRAQQDLIPNKTYDFKDDSSDERYEAIQKNPTVVLNLRAAVQPTADDIDPVLNTILNEYDRHVPALIVLPGGDSIAARPRCSPCFHIDISGDVVFTLDEANHAQRVFYESRVCEEALKAVKEGLLGWRLPQQRRSMSATFCNEALYGRLNLVEVTGLFRVPSSIETE